MPPVTAFVCVGVSSFLSFDAAGFSQACPEAPLPRIRMIRTFPSSGILFAFVSHRYACRGSHALSFLSWGYVFGCGRLPLLLRGLDVIDVGSESQVAVWIAYIIMCQTAEGFRLL